MPEHRWNDEFCSCGQDAVTCQVGGERICGALTNWIEGIGNICHKHRTPAGIAIQTAWKTNTTAMDWLGMEHVLREILRSYNRKELDSREALRLVDQAIGAFTKRGTVL